MSEILEILQPTGVFLLGLAIRLMVFVLVFAVACIPVVAVIAALVGLKRLREKWLGLETVDGLVLAGARRYSKEHAWLDEKRSGRLRVGLDDLASHVFHGVTSVELPSPGTRLMAGLPAATVRCGSRKATIPAPVDGVVSATNDAVTRDPSLLTTSPYDRGWLYAVEPAADTYRELPTGQAARLWFKGETARFTRFLEGELGLAAADGGELIVPAAALLPEDKWHTLARSFLGS